MKYFLILALIAVPAFATGNKQCPSGYTGTYPNCVAPKPADPNWWNKNANTNNNSNQQGQGQGQGQGQSQGQSQNATGGVGTGVGVGIGQGGSGGAGGDGGNSSSNAQGGNSRSSVGNVSSGSSAQGGKSSATGGTSYSGGNTLSNGSASTSGSTSNGVVNVDAADRSSSRTTSNVFIPGDLPTNAMNIVAGAQLVVAGDTNCGVLQSKVRIPIYQYVKKRRVEAGYDEDLVPYHDQHGNRLDYEVVYTPDGGYRLRGSQVTYLAGSYGNSSSNQLGLQGGGAGGYGGLSYGSGSAYQQAGVRIMLRDCIAGVYAPKAAVQPRPATRVPARPKKAAVRRPAPPRCVPVPARTCPAR